MCHPSRRPLEGWRNDLPICHRRVDGWEVMGMQNAEDGDGKGAEGESEYYGCWGRRVVFIRDLQSEAPVLDAGILSPGF